MCAVKWKSLEELGVFYGGLSGKSKDDFQDGNAKFVTYMNVYSNMSLDFTIADMVKVGEYEKQNSIKYGDILFTGSSETPDDCGMSCVVTNHINEPIYLNSFCFGFRFYEVEKFEPNFLKHYFRCIAIRKAISLTASGVTRFNVSKKRFGKIQIPLLVVSKQQEIVSQLDTFTTLISNLESELDMRRKQYEHYRNQLLDFEGVEGVEWKTLGDLSLKITDGAHTSPKSTSEGYYMPSVKDMTDYGFDFSDCKIISEEDYEDLKRIGCQPNVSDILIAKDGSMLRYVFALKEKLDIVLLSSIAIITPKQELIMSEYLVHYLKQSSVREIVIRDYSSKGGVPRIILKNFKKIIIPTPAINIQQQIVEKLDAFEQLIQSLETEIKLRKQQYEYYREKILTFE